LNASKNRKKGLRGIEWVSFDVEGLTNPRST
jgi:hypothetical protein